MPLTDYQFAKLTPDTDLADFDCGDKDITDWLKDDSKDYQTELIANTYLFLDQNKVIAYFCIFNDCLNDIGKELGIAGKFWSKFHRKIDLPNPKRIKSYPAIKIGRLGVCLSQQKNGLAYELMDFIKGYSLLEHKPACRLLLLDAYNRPRQVNYYTQNGFQFLQQEDENDEKRIMYFDLRRLE